MQSFYCQLCQKGYSRMNDYEAHLSSYDHSHKQRLRDMKAMVRDPQAAARARRQEARAEAVVSIKVGEGQSATAGGGFKRGGFKKTGFKAAFVPVDEPAGRKKEGGGDSSVAKGEADAEVVGGGAGEPRASLVESDTEDEGYEVYDPRCPTD